MRHRSWFTRFPSPLPAPASTPEPVIETPITSEFTPGQTLALLRMRGAAAREVYDKLIVGTARPTLEDYTDLATLGYARRQADGFHRLTPHGHFKAKALAKALAAQLGLPVTIVTPNRRSAFRPGVLSQNGNW